MVTQQEFDELKAERDELKSQLATMKNLAKGYRALTHHIRNQRNELEKIVRELSDQDKIYPDLELPSAWRMSDE